MIKALIIEARVLLAEWLAGCALDVMPKQAPEAVPLAKAIGGYAEAAKQLNRWGCA